MKRLIKLLLIFVAFQVVMMIVGCLLRQRYLRQEVGEDEVNAVGVTGGAEKKITTQAFQGGYSSTVLKPSGGGDPVA